MKNTRQGNNTSRFFSSTNIVYKFNDWLSATYRIGLDTYSESSYAWINKGGGNGFAQELRPGQLRTIEGKNTIVDQSVLITANKAITQDLKFNTTLGLNYRVDEYKQAGLESLGQVVYGFLEHRNYTSTRSTDWRNGEDSFLNFQLRQAWRGVFLDANLDYKGFLYLNLAGRYEEVSTLIGDKQKQLYPGVSVSFVPTSAFPEFGAGVLDFLKIRFAAGSSANFGVNYLVSQRLDLNAQARTAFGGANVVTSSVNSRLAYPTLGPELLQEIEGGVEAELFERKIKVNASLYSRQSFNLQLPIGLDPTTGYASTTINAGQITNRGIEGTVTVTPLRTSDWTLDITANYTKNISRVDELTPGVTSVPLNGFTTEASFAEVGQPIGVIKGIFVQRSPTGQLIVNDAGSYLPSNNIGVIADPNPQWFGSAMINLRWKSLSFGMQWDYVAGG
ncbi:MAG: hypothetical protein ACKO96_29280, partial [Flammeovirgaceae bacterium]